jgi:solute carrier family 31 (copper transporter), member 1
MFAGSCIGIICLVCSLELLRRLGKEYDRYVVRQYDRQSYQHSPTESSDDWLHSDQSSGQRKDMGAAAIRTMTQRRSFKPNIFQQLIRALLHMLQFGLAYFIMLLAMYYNGYIIICILIGAFLGSFIFNWDTLSSVSWYELHSAAWFYGQC